MIIYLIGTRHDYQCKTGIHDEEFLQFLERECNEKSINLIAEELNEEEVIVNKGTDSLARIMANKQKIKHKFCDPDSKKRIELGIKSHDEIKKELGLGSFWTKEQDHKLKERERFYWPIREKYWLEMIQEDQSDKYIFICGAKHIETFGKLLKDKEIKAQVIIGDWQPISS